MTTTHRRIVHESSQPYIKDESTSLTHHLERIGADPLTRTMVASALLALKDKSDLCTALFEENERLKGVAK
jgi:hypothetical protein